MVKKFKLLERRPVIPCWCSLAACRGLGLPPRLATLICYPFSGRSGETDDSAIGMKPQAASSSQEALAGLVERVTYHNAENGFCVLRAKARGHRDLVTVVGHAAAIAAGEWIMATG